MKVMTKEDAAELLKADALDSFVSKRLSQLPPAGSAYMIPPDTGAKTALAKFLAYLLLRDSGVCVYLTGWKLRPFSEHLDLFYGYRRSAGEARSLSEAPVHYFDRHAHDALVSILCMVFYFDLEAWIFDVKGTTLARISHTGGLEIQSEGEGDLQDFAKDPEKFLKPLVTFKKQD